MNIFFGKPLLMPAKYTVLAGEGLGDIFSSWINHDNKWNHNLIHCIFPL